VELVESSLEVIKRQVDVVVRVLFSCGLGSVRFMVGLDHIKGLFQPKQFYDLMILRLLRVALQ